MGGVGIGLQGPVPRLLVGRLRVADAANAHDAVKGHILQKFRVRRGKHELLALGSQVSNAHIIRRPLSRNRLSVILEAICVGAGAVVDFKSCSGLDRVRAGLGRVELLGAAAFLASDTRYPHVVGSSVQNEIPIIVVRAQPGIDS